MSSYRQPSARRTFYLSQEASKALDAMSKASGLKLSAVVERLLLGLKVGERNQSS
jgi:hypothetical protein